MTTVNHTPRAVEEQDLDTLLTALYVTLHDELPPQHLGRPQLTNDAELLCLAVAQVLLGARSERAWLRAAPRRLGHLFPHLPSRERYNRRLRGLGPALVRALRLLATLHPATLAPVLLVDTTPVPCGTSRETVKRSDLAGSAAYGYCAAYSRFYWGYKLVLLAAPDGYPLAFDLVPANTSDPDALRAILAQVDLDGRIVLGDKGFAGRDLEAEVDAYGATLVRPDRRDEAFRYGNLGRVRQWIESVFGTCKGQLGLEGHGGRTVIGVAVRVAQRLLALGAVLWANAQAGRPGRHLTAYDH